jgi:GLPGLI family protein
MKKNVLIMLFALICTFSYSQNFQGIAYYTSIRNMSDTQISSSTLDPGMQEKILESLKKGIEKDYTLTFNEQESIYQMEKKLDSPQPNGGEFQVRSNFSGNDSKYYKNLKTNNFINERDLFGKEFLVCDSLEKMNWIIKDEQKQIGSYNCYKAQIIVPVTEKDWKKYEESKKRIESGQTNFITLIEPKEKIIEAWYTLDIPISNGPDKFWGLPGLILELHNGNTTILCSKIILNPKEKTEIIKPKTGKKVTQKEFEELKEEKIKSMTNENGVIELKSKF